MKQLHKDAIAIGELYESSRILMELRQYQHECIDALFDYFEKKGGTDANTGLPTKANPLAALPCSTGKSVIIAYFIKRALQMHPETRICMATHVKTLIRQNYSKIKEAWPQAPVGLFSAGLKKKQHADAIVYGGIRSMVGKYPMFGYRDILIIDETHLVSEDSEASYIKFIWELMYGEYVKPGEEPTHEQFQKALANPNCNPYLKIIGFSATCFRQGLGYLTNGRIFTDFAYNLCTPQGYTRLFAEGYLSPIYARPTQTTLDVTGLRVVNGDYNQTDLQAKIDTKDINQRCLAELVQNAHNRRCGLIFASGIEHAEHLNELMNNVFNEECVVVHSGNKEYPRTEVENDDALEMWLTGQVKWAVNVNSLTTGVDNTMIDIMAVLRPTLSSVLWVQLLGRASRPYYAKGYNLNDLSQRLEALKNGKLSPVVLDFAGNTPRLGPMDDPKIPKMKSGIEGDMPVKICGQCGTYNHARATECICCEAPFPINSKLSSTPSAQPLLRSEMPIVESYNVIRAIYQPYVSKATKRNMIKVAYYCDRLKTFFEYVTLESNPTSGKLDYATKRGRDFWRQRHHTEPPLSNETFLLMSESLRVPKKVNVWTNKQNPEILSAEF